MNNLSRLTLTSLSVSAALFGAPSVQAEGYSPVIESIIYVTRTNMTCNLHKNSSVNDNDLEDYCDADASIDIRLSMSQMRSVAGNGTADKKIVRFAVSDEGSGAGIHVVDDLTQGNTWKQSNANRKTRIGPFAKRYFMSIKPTDGVIPHMVKNFPGNENTNYENRETSGFDIGVNGSATADVGATGPKTTGQVGASYSYNQSKILVYNTKDYSVVNRTSGADFDLSFVFSLDSCDLLVKGNSHCKFTKPHWSSSSVFSKSKFKPISYANFNPNFDVIYEVLPSETGYSSFDLELGFEPQVRFGRVYPNIAFSHYGPSGSSYSDEQKVSIELAVDWSHPLFQPEAHVVLQSQNHNNLCLDTFGGSISTHTCFKDWWQTFGLDSDGRYKNRTGLNDQCLTVKSNKKLELQTCGNSLAQKFYWEGDELYGRYIDGTGHKYVLALDSNDDPIMQPDSQATKSNWKPALKQVELSTPVSS
jgi:hemolysin